MKDDELAHIDTELRRLEHYRSRSRFGLPVLLAVVSLVLFVIGVTLIALGHALIARIFGG